MNLFLKFLFQQHLMSLTSRLPHSHRHITESSYRSKQGTIKLKASVIM